MLEYDFTFNFTCQVDCTNKENAGIKPCEVDKVEENVYTYKYV